MKIGATIVRLAIHLQTRAVRQFLVLRFLVIDDKAEALDAAQYTDTHVHARTYAKHVHALERICARYAEYAIGLYVNVRIRNGVWKE